MADDRRIIIGPCRLIDRNAGSDVPATFLPMLLQVCADDAHVPGQGVAAAVDEVSQAGGYVRVVR